MMCEPNTTNIKPPALDFCKSGHKLRQNGPVPGENGITPVLAPPPASVPAWIRKLLL